MFVKNYNILAKLHAFYSPIKYQGNKLINTSIIDLNGNKFSELTFKNTSQQIIPKSDDYVSFVSLMRAAANTSGYNTGISTDNIGEVQFAGFIFGDSNEIGVVDDYRLKGNAIDTTNYNFTMTSTENLSDERWSYSVTYTITNTSSTAFTIGEVGLFLSISDYSNYSYRVYPFMVERTAFDTPITIEAGGVGQVTYTIYMDDFIE